jgi:hypothetical protein
MHDTIVLPVNTQKGICKHGPLYTSFWACGMFGGGGMLSMSSGHTHISKLPPIGLPLSFLNILESKYWDWWIG